MIGKFVIAYSFDTNRDGNILEGNDKADWRLQELLSLLLPYLGDQDVAHFLSANSLIFTLVSNPHATCLKPRAHRATNMSHVPSI